MNQTRTGKIDNSAALIFLTGRPSEEDSSDDDFMSCLSDWSSSDSESVKQLGVNRPVVNIMTRADSAGGSSVDSRAARPTTSNSSSSLDSTDEESSTEISVRRPVEVRAPWVLRMPMRNEYQMAKTDRALPSFTTSKFVS